MSTFCKFYTRYHTFDIPTGDDGYGRRCACGTPQIYRPPTGSESAKFSDVLVEADDLRDLIDRYQGQRAMPDDVGDELCARLLLLLD